MADAVSELMHSEGTGACRLVRVRLHQLTTSCHRLKAAVQGRILLDVLAVLFQLLHSRALQGQ